MNPFSFTIRKKESNQEYQINQNSQPIIVITKQVLSINQRFMPFPQQLKKRLRQFRCHHYLKHNVQEKYYHQNRIKNNQMMH